jgi:hypothetical protein
MLVSSFRTLRDQQVWRGWCFTKHLFRQALKDPSHPRPRVINTELAAIYSSADLQLRHYRDEEGRDTPSPMSASARAVLEQ